MPGRSAEQPLPAVLGPISAFDRSVTEELLRTRPSTRALTGALRVTLERVAWDDARGRPFVRAERVSGRLDLAALLHGNGVVSGVDAVAPRVLLYHTAGDTLWSWSNNGLQRIDPLTGGVVGPGWRLPDDDVRVVIPKIGSDWQLLSADGSLWLLRNDELIRYAIPTS